MQRTWEFQKGESSRWSISYHVPGIQSHSMLIFLWGRFCNYQFIASVNWSLEISRNLTDVSQPTSSIRAFEPMFQTLGSTHPSVHQAASCWFETCFAIYLTLWRLAHPLFLHMQIRITIPSFSNSWITWDNVSESALWIINSTLNVWHLIQIHFTIPHPWFS